MQKTLLSMGIAALMFSCNTETPKTADTPATEAPAAAVDLPYKASYTSNWTAEVSDADLKLVLGTYKDWQDGNVDGIGAVMADTVVVDLSDGTHLRKPKGEITAMWKTYRDSLSAVEIDMVAFHKMYAPDKKEGYIVTWYRQIERFKDGRADSADWHDINQVKDGKLVWYSQYKRPAK